LAREKANGLKLLALILSTMLAPVPVTQEANSLQDPQPNSPADARAFSKVESLGDGTRAFFMFGTSGPGYTIRADGFGERSGIGKGRPANFSLRVGRNGHIVRFYFHEHEGDLLLIYEVGDKQVGWGYVIRLDQKTLKTKWAVPVSDFNLGPGFVEDNSIYFSAANLLARIDLRTGAYVWHHEGVQRKNALSFDGFQLPSITGDRVFFHEDGDKGKTVEIDKVTGKILSVRD
jgi:outer membrane protein assembly factor BamB